MTRAGTLALVLAAGLAGGGHAASSTDPRDAARLARALAGRTPGAPLRCVDRARLADMESHGSTILYGGTGRRLFRNDTVGNCAGLGRGDILVTRSFGSELCAGDIATTVNPSSGVLSGSCSLGPFVPYTR